jgi:hypothetical protein
MNMIIRLCLMALLLLMFAIPAGAQTINALIWDNDNASHYTDPDNWQSRGCEYGLQHALQANGVAFTTVTTLPQNLAPYDIVFVELGIYCVG